MLNEVGYGKEGIGLEFYLVYNFLGVFLFVSQEIFQVEFKCQLKWKYDIDFNMFFVIINLLIVCFFDYLLESGNYEEYMQKLVEVYNFVIVEGFMCCNILLISWDGYIYDCDFNQMLDFKVVSISQYINDFDFFVFENCVVVFNQYCYGCIVGAGLSCGGEIV